MKITSFIKMYWRKYSSVIYMLILILLIASCAGSSRGNLGEAMDKSSDDYDGERVVRTEEDDDDEEDDDGFFDVLSIFISNDDENSDRDRPARHDTSVKLSAADNPDFKSPHFFIRSSGVSADRAKISTDPSQEIPDFSLSIIP